MLLVRWCLVDRCGRKGVICPHRIRQHMPQCVSTYAAFLLILIWSCFVIQAGYQVWTAEQECRHLRHQSAEHANIIQQSQSDITQQEAQTEELFVVRRDQQQVICTLHLVLAFALAGIVYRIVTQIPFKHCDWNDTCHHLCNSCYPTM